jgi:hypothetical protein
MKLVCNTAVQQIRAERTRRALAALNLFVEELREANDRECRLEGGHQNDGDDYCVRCGVDLQT